MGFITRGFGVSVHKADCPNVALGRRNEENLSRWVSAEWEKEETSSSSSETYEASLHLVIEDGIGVIAGISTALADMKVSIMQINTQSQKNGNMTVSLVIGCRNTSHFEAIVSRLRQLPHVLSVSRTVPGNPEK